MARQGNQNPLGYRHSPLTRLKMSLVKVGKSYNKGRGHPISVEARRKIGEKQKGHGYRGGETSRLKTAESMRRVWSDPEYKARVLVNIIVSNHKSPTKPEQKVLDVIREYKLPFNFNGNNGGIIIAGKCPDFVSRNGLKCVVEVAGSYWHKSSYEQERITLFRAEGYETLVLWDTNIMRFSSEEIAQELIMFLGKVKSARAIRRWTK